MEQQVYTSAKRQDRTGFQTIARSPGLSQRDQTSFQDLYGMFGSWPRIPPKGVLSFVGVERDRWAVWMRYPCSHDASGSRENYWVHAYIVTRDELDAMGGDPFTLVDANYFLRPTESLSCKLPPCSAPKATRRDEAEYLSPLSKVPSQQLDVLLATALCPGKALLGAAALPGNVTRALVHLVPPSLRHRFTFFGLVGGLPPHEAKWMVLPPAHVKNARGDAAIATLKPERYQGPEPTSYAQAMSRYIKAGRLLEAAKLVAFAERLRANVFDDDTSHLVRVFEQHRHFIRDLDVKNVGKSIDCLRPHCNDDALLDLQKEALLDIAELATQMPSASVPLGEAIVDLGGLAVQWTTEDRNRLVRTLTAAWDCLYEDPQLLPVLLKMSREFPDLTHQRVDALTETFDEYHGQLNQHLPVGDRIKFWGNVLELICEEGGSVALEKPACVSLLVCAAESAPAREFAEHWEMLGEKVRSADDLQEILEAVRHAQPEEAHVPVLADIFHRLDPERRSRVLHEFLLWSAGWRQVFQALARELPKLCSRHAEPLELARDIVSSPGVTFEHCKTVFLEAISACPDLEEQAAQLAVAFSMERRFALLQAVRRHLAKHRGLAFAIIQTLAPTNEEEAREFVAVIGRNGSLYRSLPRRFRRELWKIVEQVASTPRYHAAGAGPIVVRERRRKKTLKYVLAAEVLALIALGVAFAIELGVIPSPSIWLSGLRTLFSRQ